MNNKFDELTKQMAQSVTRRAALRKFGIGLAGMALACFGLANRSNGAGKACVTYADCPKGDQCCSGHCVSILDNANCGHCGNVCPKGWICFEGELGPGCAPKK